MPFIDFNTAINNFPAEGYDITIVGAGAAGILLAVKLSQAGKKVLLLESGHFNETDDKQQLNEVLQTGKFLSNAVWGRKRIVGGTTTAWGGQSLPFTPFDFEKKAWVVLSGWPISYHEVEPFYDEANAFMKIDTLNYREDIFSKIKLQPPAIDAGLLNFHVAKWAKEPNFFTLYKNWLLQHVTLVYNAQLLAIKKNNAGSIEEITVGNFLQANCKITPGELILATGAIESVRILLTNDIVNASSKKWLGKCYMDHPCVEVGDIFPANPYKIQQLFNTHAWNGRKYSVRLSLPANIQTQFQLLNCSAGIMFKPGANHFDVYAESKMFLKDHKIRRLLKIAGYSKTILKSALAYFKDNFYYKVNSEEKLVLMIEQEPIFASCIKLGDERDLFGVPKAVIHWEISPKTWETALKISEIIASELNRLGIAKVKLYKHINKDNDNWLDCLTDVNHHMGGARMGSTADEGVVDSNLKLWGTGNLYVCSCAVFPTTSHSNPTLTLLALASRLSKYILQK
ncbi:MAG: GMC oxidoreductase [Ferruginibacter sp.]